MAGFSNQSCRFLPLPVFAVGCGGKVWCEKPPVRQRIEAVILFPRKLKKVFKREWSHSHCHLAPRQRQTSAGRFRSLRSLHPTLPSANNYASQGIKEVTLGLLKNCLGVMESVKPLSKIGAVVFKGKGGGPHHMALCENFVVCNGLGCTVKGVTPIWQAIFQRVFIG